MIMKNIHTKIDYNGKVLIPLEFRKQLKCKKGDSFILRLINDELRMVSLKKAFQDAQDIMEETTPEGVSLVDELIAERRLESEIENQKLI
jgi:bifunctional DNA-binding transcriptional regulator/antitoxin component of YhaV-PrlF toxin-antitoxin module